MSSAHDGRPDRPADESRAPFPPLYARDLLPAPNERFPALLPDLPDGDGQPASAPPSDAAPRPLSLGLDAPGRPGH